MTTYLQTYSETQSSAVVDPGDDADKILASAEGTRIDKILLNQAHSDHVSTLAAANEASGAPVYLQALEHEQFGTPYDIALADAQALDMGQHHVQPLFILAQTPGMTTIIRRQKIVFAWPDDSTSIPSHGPGAQIGIEGIQFEALLARG